MVPVTGNENIAVHYKSNEQHNNGYVNNLDSPPDYLEILSQSVQSENYVVPNGEYISPHFDYRVDVLKPDEDYMEPLGRDYSTYTSRVPGHAAELR